MSLEHLAQLKRGLLSAAQAGGGVALSLKLVGAPVAGKVKARLRSHQRQDVLAVLQSFDRRIIVPRVYRLWADVMDFNKMPFSGPGSGALLDAHGDSSAEALVEERYPWMDAVEVQAQSLKVKHHVRLNHKRFWDTTKSRLSVCGSGSIFESLWRGEVPDIPDYLHMADDMIAARYY